MEDLPTDPDVHEARKAAAAPRRVAGRYLVDRLIARGGMASVYLAEHVDLQRSIALKVLQPPEAYGDVDFEGRFRQEALALAQLSHPNIVVIHDFGQLDDGRFFLAMEYVEGLRLSDLVRHGPLEPTRAIALMLQVCRALRYAHGRGIVHRDLKPSNLLVTHDIDRREVVKVVDFGLATLAGTEPGDTSPGVVMGSPHCMSPEQVLNRAVDARTDVYAIGILLFRSVLGHYPFHGTDASATMTAHVRDPVPTFFSVAPEVAVPAGLEEVVRRCLAKRPSDRYADMDALINALAALVQEPVGLPTGTVPTSTIARRLPEAAASSRSLAVPLIIAGLLAVTAVGIGWFVLSGDASAPAPVEELNPLPDVVAGQPPPGAEVPPEPAEGTAEEAEPEPVQAKPKASEPKPRRRPRPEPKREAAPKPKPEPVKAAPEPEPKPEPVQAEPVQAEPDPVVPEGYQGLPDDF